MTRLPEGPASRGPENRGAESGGAESGGPEAARPQALLDPLFGAVAMAAVFDDRARLAAMLAFEVALARAEAAVGLVPEMAAETIAGHADPDRYDLGRLAAETMLAGNPAIPLVKHLQAAVGPEARDHVHLGATSQDVIDTGTMLQMRAGLDLIIRDTTALAETLAALADRHRGTLQIGRTLLQHAVPVTFGLKVAGWLTMAARARAALVRVRGEALALQFGGAAGTLSALGSEGLEVAIALAAELDLPLPALPWHTDRTRIAEIAGALGMVAGMVGKIAGDLVQEMSSDVAEAFEATGPGKGGSSAMPHKRNPVHLVAARAAAAEAIGCVPVLIGGMVQEFERAAGNWHAEWRTLPRLFVAAHGAVVNLARALDGLEIDPARMRANLEATRGLVMAEAATARLAAAVGKVEARRLIERAVARAVAEDLHLEDALAEDPAVVRHLGPEALAETFDPAGYLGATEAFVDRALDAWDASRDGLPGPA
ncbi:3-carboxy-cis,cis-muconate cycloisomerase [Prosthecomicrobium hirschii]|uniref:3-carboxy-cis,cis-muconate cycloisomerase n=1 Tax=Prosthecodimorpha hirschii TaxID=665126 RepID=UPI00221F2F05|nr:3-carboxy-cis,cis-muconate cycloisomerase [Prosthecomicrobium hirschii]MCW1839654.1 3-carboxy-cis,cis-muconate cycloisomerase [Prosthecomicrobium hirschii]